MRRLSPVLLVLWLAPTLALAQSAVPEGFAETSSGCVPDGGLCLVPPEHQSEPVTVSVQLGEAKRIGLHRNTIYGTARVEVIAPDGRALLAVSDSLLHGHEWFNDAPPIPYLDYPNGAFRDRNRRLRQVCEAAGHGKACVLRITYRHPTSEVRWERAAWKAQGRGRRVDTLDVSWWGVVPDAERDYQPVLAHILNVARFRRASVVRFPACGDYGYYGTLAIPEVTLEGAGGTELVTATDDLGHTFRPVRVVDCPTRLLALPGTAARHLRTSLGRRDARYLPPDPKAALQSHLTAFYVQSGVARAGLKNLVLDGNWRAQAPDMEALKRDERGRDLFETFRNSPAHTGFAASRQNQVEIPEGQHLTLENVAILGYSTATLGDANNTWTLRNVRLGDAPLNHLVYCSDGDWTNVTLTGFSWHVGPTCPKNGPDGKPMATTIRNLVVEDGRPNRFRQPFDGLLGFRGSAVHIDGFYFDLRDSGYQRPFSGDADRLWAQNGVVIFDDQPSPGLYSGDSNGLVLDNVEVFLNGHLQYLIGRGKKSVIGLQNVRVQSLPGTTSSLNAVLPTGASGTGPLVFVDDLDLGVPLRAGFARVHGKSATPRVRLCADEPVQGLASTVSAAECAELRARYRSALPGR